MSTATTSRNTAVYRSSRSRPTEDGHATVMAVLQNKELVVDSILPFVGPGQFIFVAGVCKEFKEFYEAYFAKIEGDKLPYTTPVDSPYRRPAMVHETFHSAAFFSLGCAEFWDKDVGRDQKENTPVWRSLAKSGNVAIAKWAAAKGFTWHFENWYVGWIGVGLRLHSCTFAAASHGSLDFLIYLLATERIRKDKLIYYGAAEGGHIEILEWAQKQRISWGENTKHIFHFAARNGHVNVLEWARKNGCERDQEICRVAAEGGHLKAIEWALNNGCELDEGTCSAAARGGQLEVLKWARCNGCPWDERTCSQAAYWGKFVVLVWAHENGCPWDANTLADALSECNGNWLKDGERCANFADCGQFELLKYLLANGCPWNEQTCLVAAWDLELLKLVYGKGCPWDERVCEDAARYGNTEVLKYAHQNGCRWDASTFKGAIDALRELEGERGEGQFEALKYAFDNGCLWDRSASFMMANLIADGDYPEIIEWARENALA